MIDIRNQEDLLNFILNYNPEEYSGEDLKMILNASKRILQDKLFEINNLLVRTRDKDEKILKYKEIIDGLEKQNRHLVNKNNLYRKEILRKRSLYEKLFGLTKIQDSNNEH